MGGGGEEVWDEFQPDVVVKGGEGEFWLLGLLRNQSEGSGGWWLKLRERKGRGRMGRMRRCGRGWEGSCTMLRRTGEVSLRLERWRRGTFAMFYEKGSRGR